MTSTPRQRGDAFERRVRRLLVDAGYFTARSSGSSGPFDVMALRRDEVVLVQCKADGRLDPGEWNECLAVADEVGGVAVLAQRPEHGRHVEYRRLLHRKGEPRDGRPLWEPWQLVPNPGW